MRSNEEILSVAEDLDNRRRHQIENQIQSINRLMEGSRYDQEMKILHEQLAEAQSWIDKIKGNL